MTWPEAAVKIGEGLFWLGIALAVLTNFWDELFRRRK